MKNTSVGIASLLSGVALLFVQPTIAHDVVLKYPASRVLVNPAKNAIPEIKVGAATTSGTTSSYQYEVSATQSFSVGMSFRSAWVSGTSQTLSVPSVGEVFVRVRARDSAGATTDWRGYGSTSAYECVFVQTAQATLTGTSTEFVSRHQLPNGAFGFGLLDDGRSLISDGYALYLEYHRESWDYVTYTTLPASRRGASVPVLETSPDGTKVLIGTMSGTNLFLSIISLANGSVTALADLPMGARACWQGSRFVYATQAASVQTAFYVVRVDVGSGAVRRVAELPGSPGGVAVASDGTVYVGIAGLVTTPIRTGEVWRFQRASISSALITNTALTQTDGELVVDTLDARLMAFDSDGWLWIAGSDSPSISRDYGYVLRYNHETGAFRAHTPSGSWGMPYDMLAVRKTHVIVGWGQQFINIMLLWRYKHESGVPSLRATTASPSVTGMSLSWVNEFPNVRDYVVKYREVGSDSWVSKTVLATNPTNMTVQMSDLHALHTYEFTITARNQSRKSLPRGGGIWSTTGSSYDGTAPIPTIAAEASHNAETYPVNRLNDGDTRTWWRGIPGTEWRLYTGFSQSTTIYAAQVLFQRDTPGNMSVSYSVKTSSTNDWVSWSGVSRTNAVSVRARISADMRTWPAVSEFRIVTGPSMSVTTMTAGQWASIDTAGSSSYSVFNISDYNNKTSWAGDTTLDRWSLYHMIPGTSRTDTNGVAYLAATLMYFNKNTPNQLPEGLSVAIHGSTDGVTWRTLPSGSAKSLSTRYIWYELLPQYVGKPRPTIYEVLNRYILKSQVP